MRGTSSIEKVEGRSSAASARFTAAVSVAAPARRAERNSAATTPILARQAGVLFPVRHVQPRLQPVDAGGAVAHGRPPGAPGLGEHRHRDPDEAIARVAGAAKDWSGGTRIGETLRAFNRLWSRRVLGQGAIVLLITDGLDRDGGEGLAAEMARLQGSCRRLIWPNPLLRYAGFEPKSAGVKAMLPYVDDFRPVHNLDSLAGVISALSEAPVRRAASA